MELLIVDDDKMNELVVVLSNLTRNVRVRNVRVGEQRTEFIAITEGYIL